MEGPELCGSFDDLSVDTVGHALGRHEFVDRVRVTFVPDCAEPFLEGLPILRTGNPGS